MQPKTRLLMTFTGFHDPFSDSLVEGVEQEGPVLGLLRARSFSNVVLFSTPNTIRLTDATKNAIGERFPTVHVEIRHIGLDDPTDYLAILQALRAEYGNIAEQHREAAFSIATASGTPHMHACWMLLAASGEIPARLLHARPPRFVDGVRPAVSEIDLTDPRFPTVRSTAWAEVDLPADHDDPADLIRKLGIVGDHPALTRALETASMIGVSNVPVLILGESGTGKEKVARLIHHISSRSDQPFVAVNCAAIPIELAESTLFGHRKGAFTGATADAKGRFELADGGTIFLDEVGDLPMGIQAKLLRVLQEGEVEPVGGGKAHHVSVRVVAATNLDLQDAVASGRFREDLYYRLTVGEIQLPPLRERRSDIVRLAIFFLDEINATLRKPRRLTPEALSKLQDHAWPGNIRELQNTIHRAALLSKEPQIAPANLELRARSDHNKGLDGLPDPERGFSVEEYLREARRRLFSRALERSGGNQSEAARLLGVTPQAVFKFLKASE